MSDIAGPPRPQTAGTPAPDGALPASVLIVDDDAAKRLALKAVLLPLGYAIVEADSGVAALRCVMNLDFAVILLDVRMPDMDGFETARCIRQRLQSEMTPIIFITALASDEMGQADRFAQGAVDFMCAPVAPDELRAKVSVFANLFVKATTLAQQALDAQASADRFSLLADAAPIGIFQTDADNCYVYTNPRWSEITGVGAGAALGREWDTIIGSEQHAAGLAELPEFASERAELCRRFVITPSGSASRIVLVTSRSILDGKGAVAGWVGTIADVTAEAGAEAAMSDARDAADEASRLKSDFLANMSHEIRTPMNGVICMTDMLLETSLDVRQRDFAQTVRNSGEALLTIINDILDFSKVEAGRLEIEDIDFDLRAVVDGVADLLAASARAKGLEFSAVTEIEVPAAVSGDPGRVRQVLTNLIGNAIKFTQAGSIVVRVMPEEVAGTEIIIRFEVSDTGDGVAPSQLATVFQPFVQADTSTSRRYGGTGLGLAISSHLVGLMGGTCGVSSQLGTGSIFWFTIRVHADEQPPVGPPAPVPGFAGVSALIVESNAPQRAILSELLTELGMTVGVADSGLTALASLRAAAAEDTPVALVMLDRAMPAIDTVDLVNTIHADAGLTAAVVLMSDPSHQTDVGSGAVSARCASVSKPIRREDLQACLEVALGLPPREVQSPATTPVAELLPGNPARGRLLLAEDNLINQKVAVAMLSGAGYRVDTVPDGAAAVRAIAVQAYDAVLMDCQMPEMNGFEAPAAIRAYEEGSARRTPIIALTAGARREDRDMCLAEGMDGYLAKPLSKDALVALVAQWVTRQPLLADSG